MNDGTPGKCLDVTLHFHLLNSLGHVLKHEPIPCSIKQQGGPPVCRHQVPCMATLSASERLGPPQSRGKELKPLKPSAYSFCYKYTSNCRGKLPGVSQGLPWPQQTTHSCHAAVPPRRLAASLPGRVTKPASGGMSLGVEFAQGIRVQSPVPALL